LEKWQEALKNWDDWVRSIADTKATISAKYGDIDKLLVLGKPVWKIERNGDSTTIRIKHNKAYDTLSDAYDEIEEIGNEFLFDKIGLYPHSFLYEQFFSYWIDSISPELREYSDLMCFLQLRINEADTPNISHYSKLVTRQGKKVIVDSIAWQRGKVSRAEAAKQLLQIKWASPSELKTPKGRPKAGDRLDCESLVCLILRDFQGLKLKEIAAIFGWKPPESVYKGKTNISRTVSNRIERVRRLLG
jgi:hypothetical protein